MWGGLQALLQEESPLKEAQCLDFGPHASKGTQIQQIKLQILQFSSSNGRISIASIKISSFSFLWEEIAKNMVL